MACGSEPLVSHYYLRFTGSGLLFQRFPAGPLSLRLPHSNLHQPAHEEF
jgi:hypothetical protein